MAICDLFEVRNGVPLRIQIQSHVSIKDPHVILGAVKKSCLDHSHLVRQMLCLVLFLPLTLSLLSEDQLILHVADAILQLCLATFDDLELLWRKHTE